MYPLATGNIVTVVKLSLPYFSQSIFRLEDLLGTCESRQPLLSRILPVVSASDSLWLSFCFVFGCCCQRALGERYVACENSPYLVVCFSSLFWAIFLVVIVRNLRGVIEQTMLPYPFLVWVLFVFHSIICQPFIISFFVLVVFEGLFKPLVTCLHLSWFTFP